jgi:elongation factor G
MRVEVTAPSEFQGTLIGNLTRRRGVIVSSETNDDYTTITVDVGLSSMFGYSTDLRSTTQGKGEFSMEYHTHAPIPREEQQKMMAAYAKEQALITDKRGQ